jgi:hypothetical protein
MSSTRHGEVINVLQRGRLYGGRIVKRHKPQSAQEQCRVWKRRNERAFLFTSEEQLLAEVDRDTWEFAISVASGDVASAAEECGLRAIPKGAKALWGRSAAEAWSTYRRWHNRKRA